MKNKTVLRTVIYGNGGAGEALARELLRTTGHGCELIGFLGDDSAPLHSSVPGVAVLGSRADLPELIARHRVEQILFAGDDVPGRTVREFVEVCGPRRVRLRTVPASRDAPESSPVVAAIKDVDPEALLDRRPIDFGSVGMEDFFRQKTVLVTGAGGTIGSELCRRSAGYGAKQILLFDIDENALFFLEMDLREAFPECDVRALLGSVRDRSRLNEIMGRYHPDLIFHAAAHKHVPLVELAPVEAIKNNVVGTYEAAECAYEHGAGHFIFISTDKAAARTNVLGASKWLAESIVKHLGARGKTRFQSVRFGNVLDSNGSLVDVIRHRIARGASVTITHPGMKRYFMTIQEAIGLVLAAAVVGEGEVNVLDMGEPVTVDTLVRQMLYLSGLVPEQDVAIRYTHPRPGERLTEQVYGKDEQVRHSSFPRISIVTGGAGIDVGHMLEEAGRVMSDPEAAVFLRRWVPHFSPSGL